MSNIKENDDDDDYVPLIGKTIKIDDHNYSTTLIIPPKFAKALGIENSKVSMAVLEDCDGDKHLLVTKYHREIILEQKT
jgi:hypothetical protein